MNEQLKYNFLSDFKDIQETLLPPEEKSIFLKKFLEAQQGFARDPNKDKTMDQFGKIFDIALEGCAKNQIKLPGLSESETIAITSEEIFLTANRLNLELGTALSDMATIKNKNEFPEENKAQAFLQTFLATQNFTAINYEQLQQANEQILSKSIKYQSLFLQLLSEFGIELPAELSVNIPDAGLSEQAVEKQTLLEKLDQRFSQWRQSTRMAFDKVVAKWSKKKAERSTAKEVEKTSSSALFSREESKQYFGFDGALLQVIGVENNEPPRGRADGVSI